MVEFKRGDILTEDVEALVNTVNCVGVMGRGIALQFKRKFPENFREYAAACKSGNVQPGHMFVHRTGQLTNPRYVINFPTKRHWRGNSRLADIRSGLETLIAEVRALGVNSIAIPPLGSGLGGLDWQIVRPLIEAAFADSTDVRVVVYEPLPADQPISAAHEQRAPGMTPGRASLVGLIQTYLEALLDPFVTLLEIHKLMYFMQEAGQPLRLEFRAAKYGPYAENLRHVMNRVEGHFLSGYADGGDDPTKEIELLAGAAKAATEVISGDPDTSRHFERVAELVEGFETPSGLELLSTVHWVVVRDKKSTRADVVSTVHGWGERKQRFTARQIDLALDRLQSRDWLPADAVVG